MKIPSKDIVFVAFQFLLFIAFTFDVAFMTILFPVVLFWFGVIIFILGAMIIIVAVLQLNIHLSPFPSPLPDSKLILTGVYKFIRHPIYSGLILGFCGYAIISDSGYKLFITFILFLLFYFKTVYEERLLAVKFSEYSEYKERSGRFFPKVW